MAEYQVQAIDSLHFEISNNFEKIGSLEYKSWFKFDALMKLDGFKEYQVLPKGFWGTTIEVRKEDVVILTFKMNWSGDIVIQTFFTGEEKGYVFKHKGLFKDSYVLLDQEGKDLLLLKPRVKWSKLTYEYEIATTDEFERIEAKKILLLTTLHCANYYLSIIASV